MIPRTTGRGRTPRKPDPYRDRVALVTGAARGIGLATATALHRRGARVVLADVDADLALAEAAGLGPGASGTGVDVTDADSVAAAFDHAEATFGPVDVLVNNAGIMPLGPLAEEPEEVTRRILDVNVLGVLHGCKVAAARMAPRGHGHVVNIASMVGRYGVPSAVTYSASKYAVVGATEALRYELADAGVDVSVVLPSMIRTELASGLRSLPGMPDLGPDDVAAAVLSCLARPRFAMSVPGSMTGLYRFTTLLPRPLAERFWTASGGNDLLGEADPQERVQYEARARGGTG